MHQLDSFALGILIIGSREEQPVSRGPARRFRADRDWGVEGVCHVAHDQFMPSTENVGDGCNRYAGFAGNRPNGDPCWSHKASVAVY